MAYELSCDRCNKTLDRGPGRPSWVKKPREFCEGCLVVAKELDLREREIVERETKDTWERIKTQIAELHA